jgi:hypothetical protein
MKTYKYFAISLLTLLVLSCSSDDDNGNNDPQLSTLELLNSGRWYLESKTPGSFSACEKSGYLEFSNNTDIALNFFDDQSGPCESTGVVNGTFTLSNNNLVINASGEVISVTIDAISENELTVTSSTETIVLDKIEG